MKNPTGPCPVCHQPLKPTDDIVICPECGAPYHRACYQQVQHCVFEAQHGTGFEFTSPEQTGSAIPPDGVAPPPTTQQVSCPACGAGNDARNIFCEKCGSPLYRPAPGAYQQPGNAPQQTWQTNNMPPNWGSPYGNPFGGAGFAPPINLNETLDDISLRDWSCYIGSSAPTYIARFQQQQARGTKAGFMFSAFFLGPFYFAYRKMWGWAALAFAVWMLLSMPSILLIMVTQGNPSVAGLSLTFVDNLSSLAFFLNLVGRSLCGIFALTLYRQSAGKKIKALRASTQNEAEYQQQLVVKGGASVLGVLAVVGAMLLCSFAIMPVAGQDILNYYFPEFYGMNSPFTGPLASKPLATRFFLTFWPK